MLLAYSQVCFAVLVAVFCHAQALNRSHHNNTLANNGISSDIRCSWNCTVIESDLTEEIAEEKLIQLVVKYENKVDDKCVNQAFRNSSGNVTEHWQIWLANKQRSAFAKAMESWENLMFCADVNEERKEIRGACTLKPVTTTATRPTYYSGSSPIFVRGHLADLGIQFDNTDCNTAKKDHGQPCLNISKSTRNNTISTKSPTLERGGWSINVFFGICFVFSEAFRLYSPAFLCIFSPTEVKEDGVCQIVLEGASPVSFRSFVANYFFSKNDTIWHRTRMFILRAVVLPVLFLGPAIFAQYSQRKILFPASNILGVSQLFQPWMLVFCVCYLILSFNISFSTGSSSKPNHACLACKFVKSKTLICREVLPKQIINHLRLQPLILVKCWRAFIWCLLKYFKVSFVVLPSAYKVSAMVFLRRLVFVVFLAAIPAVIVILLIVILFVAFGLIVATSPVQTLCGISIPVYAYSDNPHLQLFLGIFVSGMVAVAAILSAANLLRWAGLGILRAIELIFILLVSEESLPFVACVVLVLYYMWSSYSSFTNKYQDLALALFKHHKKSQRSQVTDVLLKTDSLPVNTTNVMKIPKELFHMACEELMPIREGFCIMILKIILIVFFVLFTFSKLLNIGATPAMKALLTLLTGSCAKIVAICIDGGRQKMIEAISADEKIPIIVQNYIKRTSGTNQGQENCGSDGDEVLLLATT